MLFLCNVTAIRVFMCRSPFYKTNRRSVIIFELLGKAENSLQRQ